MFRRTRRLLCSVAAAGALTALGAVPQPAHAAPVRIYPLGDSITYGATYPIRRPAQVPPAVFGGDRGGDTPGGYRQPLTLALTASGVEHQMVGASTYNSSRLLDALGQNHHDGHPGYRVDQVAAALDGFSGGGSDDGGHWLTGTPTRLEIHPDVTVIHLGTNDIYQRYDPGTTYAGPGGMVNIADPAQRDLFLDHLTTRLDALVDKIQALRPGSRVVLSNVVPLVLPHYDVMTYEYAAKIAALVAVEQAADERVVYADVWSKFAVMTPAGVVIVPGLISPDNAHPTPAGYAILAAVYREAVVAALDLA